VEHLKEERWEQFRNRHGDWGRDMVLYLARHHCGLTLKDLGQRAGLINERSLTKAIHRFEVRLKEDAELAKQLALAQVQLSSCRDLTP
jgi:chromosomal replication initiation ATPase DnaA